MFELIDRLRDELGSPAGVDAQLHHDLQVCRAQLHRGSKSFKLAALLLPPRVRWPATALYAFCRVADDAIDSASTVDDRERALQRLHERLDAIYDSRPINVPIDRAFAWVVQRHGIPRLVPAALLEGFEWDASGRSYATLDELVAYCVRVASTVGVMMTLVMGRDEPAVLARACDLGIGMQLTNICRDVGEDARAGRVYLPREMLAAARVNHRQLGPSPTFTPELGLVIRELLDVAETFYDSADAGLSRLPPDCRMGIRAARFIYAEIGHELSRAGYNSVAQRAIVPTSRKLQLLRQAASSPPALFERSSPLAPPHPEAAFLTNARHRQHEHRRHEHH